MSPEASEINVGLWHVHVSEQEPKAEDGFGKDVKNGVGDDLAINIDLPGTIGDTPNAVVMVRRLQQSMGAPGQDLHWVGSPEQQGEAGDGSEEATDFATLLHGHSSAVNGQVPDHNQIGDAGNSIPVRDRSAARTSPITMSR